jgi:hypothetical protein
MKPILQLTVILGLFMQIHYIRACFRSLFLADNKVHLNFNLSYRILFRIAGLFDRRSWNVTTVRRSFSGSVRCQLSGNRYRRFEQTHKTSQECEKGITRVNLTKLFRKTEIFRFFTNKLGCLIVCALFCYVTNTQA